MNFVTWAIRNPIPVIVLFVALCTAGLISFGKLGVQDRPDIELPAVTVTVSYPGVTPAQLETEITRKIEDSIATVVGVEHMTSTINNGSSTTVIEFHLESDINQALDDVRDAVTRIRSDLPQDALEPIVSRITTAGEPVVTYSVAAENMSDTELSWFVDLTVIRELTAVEGVGKINRVGGVTREIRVDLDPDRMGALGATAFDVSRQLRRTQAEYPGGEARLGGREQSVRTIGTIETPAQLGELPIQLTDGRSVRLDTMADIHDQAAEVRQLALLDGKPVVSFQVMRAWGASALGVADGVALKVAEMQKRYPNIKFVVVSSTVNFIRESFHSSMEMLVEGALLAIIVVWLFLRDWRATIISATALPLAVIPTFWVIYLLGYTLNLLTLLALSLVVGMLVDDAIVEVENIVRHLRMGKKPLQAASDAAIEIGLAVVATTFTLCAVFVPVAFMEGMSGKFFRPFAFTATVAVLFSLLVARLLTPMMAAYYMKAHQEVEEDGPIKRWYLTAVARCIEHRNITLAVATVIFTGSIALAPFLSKTFSPPGDLGYTTLTVELAPGVSLEDSRQTSEQIRERLMRIPDAQSIYTTIGTAGDVRKSSLVVTLKPRSERKGNQQQFQRMATAALKDVPGVRLSFGGQMGGRLTIMLAGDDPEKIEMAALAVERDLRKIPGLGAVTSGASLLKPEIIVRPLPERAAELGVTTETLGAVTRIATSGDVDTGLAKLNLPNRQVPIRVRLNDTARTDLDHLRMLPVPAKNGPVPLMNVADVSVGAGPAQITRYDRDRNISVNADLNGQPLGDMLAIAHSMPALQHLPPGVTTPVSGESQFLIQLFSGFVMAMGVGILCIYMVLVLLFRELLQPLTILSALPPSAGGAIIGLLLTGNSFSVPSLIGMLMLMGIVTKNSILLVEYAEKARREGMTRFDALVDACSKRVRPIVMTTIAMGAGMFPIALSLTGDASFRSPMAVAVIAGLLTSTALSLFVVPAVFTLIDDLQEWITRLFRGKDSDEHTDAPLASVTPQISDE